MPNDTETESVYGTLSGWWEGELLLYSRPLDQRQSPTDSHRHSEEDQAQLSFGRKKVDLWRGPSYERHTLFLNSINLGKSDVMPVAPLSTFNRIDNKI